MRLRSPVAVLVAGLAAGVTGSASTLAAPAPGDPPGIAAPDSAGFQPPAYTLIGSDDVLPHIRRLHTSVYDPLRQRMIVIGGTNNSTLFFNDVWSLPMDGPAIWTQEAVSGTPPQPIASHSAIYDPVRDRIIVFGGFTQAQGRINEVWSLSLSGVATWTRLLPTGGPPTARNLHSAIYDPVRDRMIVYGGYASDFYLGDVWALELSGAVPNWTLLAPTPFGGPTIRRQHAAIYDPVRDRMVMSGGLSVSGTLGDMWAFSLASATWTAIQTQGPTPLPNDSHSAVYDPWADRMVVYGGIGPSFYRSDAWAFPLSGPPIWSQISPSGTLPDGRMLHTAIVDAPRQRMVVFAGHRGVDLADTWALSMVGTPRWTMLSPVPPEQQGPVPVFQQAVTGFQPLIYLGQSITLTLAVGNDGLTSDDGRIVVSFPSLTSPADGQWVSSPTTGDSPGFRVSPAGSTIEGPNCAPMTASYLVAEYADDAWTGSGAEINTLTLTVQFPAVGTFNIYVRSTMHVSGAGPCALVNGLPAEGAVATDQQGRAVRRFTVSVVTPPAPGTPPPALWDHSAILDPIRDRMILFGGFGEIASSFLWALSLSGQPGWSAIVPAVALPAPRSAHTAIYDPPRDRMIVFGGIDGVYMNDVWALGLSGTPAWSPILPGGTPPIARRDHSATYDPVRQRMIVFGGHGPTGYLDDVWALDLSGPPAWTPIVPAGTGPSPRWRHAAIYDPAGDRLLIFGGGSNTLENDLWELSLAGTPTWRQVSPPDPLPAAIHSHAFAFDAARVRGWLVGGDWLVSDVWTLSTVGDPAWTQRFPWGDPMPGRSHHTMILDPVRDRLIVSGGQNAGGRLADTWFLGLSEPPTWQRLDGPAPPPPPTAPIPVFTSVVSAVPATIVLSQTFTLQLSVRNDGAASDDGRISVSFPAFTDPADAQRVSGSGIGDTPGYVESPAGSPLLDAGCQPVAAAYLVAEYRDSDWVPFGNELNGVSLTVQPAQVGTFYFYVRSTMHTAGGAPCALVNGLPQEGEGGYTDQQGFPVRRFTVTVQPAPVTPIPVFTVVVAPLPSIFIGQAVTLTVAVRNDGAASDDGRIVVGFPALTAAGDEAFVSSSSTGDSPGYREMPAGTSLIGAACQPLTASYLTVEYADADWTWLGTETNAFSVIVQPRVPGTFYIDVRSTMHTTGAGACAWENGVPSAGESGIDLQGFPVRRFAVTVLPSPPDPNFSSAIQVSPSSVVIGQSTRITAIVTNTGALSDDGRIVFGFPAFTAPGDAAWASSASAGDTPGYREHPSGTSLPTAGCQTVIASHVTVEYADNQWTGGEPNQLAVDVVPQAVGTFTFEVRSTMHVTGGGPCDVVSDVPSGGTPGTDQQGFAIRSFTVTVLPLPPPVPSFVGTPTGIPTSIALGENFRIGLTLTNTGSSSDDGRISVGFPTLVNLADAQWVEGTGDGDAPGYQERLPGSVLMSASCQPVPAGYMVVEYADASWAAGESNTLFLMVQPIAAGTFTFEVRGTLHDPTVTAPPCAYPTAVPPNGTPAVDQQGFNVRRYTVEVIAPPTPIPTPGVTWSTLVPPPGGPAGRMNATAIHHPGRDAMIVYGGSTPLYQSEVWSLSLAPGGAWSRFTIGGPVPLVRVMHSMIYNPVDDQLVVFAGLYDDWLNDMTVLALNPQPWWFPNPGSGTPPSARGGHAAIHDPPRHRMLVIGGFGGTVKNDVWEYAPPSAGVWQPLTVAGTPMPARAQHSAIYDPVRDRVVVFGGDGGTFLNDVWALNLAGAPTWEQLLPSGVPPSGRREHTAIYDPVGDRMVVFGGFDGAQRGDIWALNLSGSPAWTRLYANAVGPASRSGHVAVYDPSRRRVVVWGGRLSANEVAQDMWLLGLDVPTPVAVSLVSSEATSERVRLTWAGEGLANVRAALYRAEGEGGDWLELGSPSVEAGERLVYEDRAVEPGRRYGYRLVVREGGEETELPAVWVTVPERAVLALVGASPNPTQGEFMVAFSLSDERAATLELFDLKGRRVASRAVGSLGAGPHRVAFTEGERLPAGVYLVRLTRGVDVLHAKAAIVR